MAQITAQMVKELRAATGAGPLDIKKALQETDGDMQKALDFLREKGLASANKKLGKERTMNEGAVGLYHNEDDGVSALVQIDCETDFVANNEKYQQFAVDVALHVGKQADIHGSAEGDTILAQAFANDESKTIEDMLKEVVATLGEKTQISGIARLAMGDDTGTIGMYQHFNKRVGAIVKVTCENAETAKGEAFQQFARDVAMHLANLKPEYLKRDDVPADVVEHERQVQKNRVIEEGKPEHIADKIVNGRMDKFYSEIVLMEQAFLKDDSMTIEQLRAHTAKELGEDVQIVQMARFGVGEGVEEEEGDE